MFNGDIDEALDYIFNEEEIPAPKKEDKPIKKDKIDLKLKAIEGNNGIYYIDGEAIRLERKQAYVNFDNKKEFQAWIKEFEAVYELAEKGFN